MTRIRKSVPTEGAAMWWASIPRFTDRISYAERIWENVMTVPECGCWIWMRSVRNKGYGQLSFDGRPTAAHRASYQTFRGHIPRGMHVLHTCDIPSCVNPDHLYLGSDVENSRDRVARGRHSKPPVNRIRLCSSDIDAIAASSLNNCELSRRYGVTRRTCRMIKRDRSRFL